VRQRDSGRLRSRHGGELPLGWLVSVAPDGAAIAVGSSSTASGGTVRDRLRIATRRAGRPFTPIGAYDAEAVRDQRPALAIHRGRYLVAFEAKPSIGSTRLGLLQALTTPSAGCTTCRTPRPTP